MSTLSFSSKGKALHSGVGMSAASSGEVHVVFFSPTRRALRSFVADLEPIEHDVVWMPGAARIRIGSELTVVLHHERFPSAATAYLEREYAHLVLLDLRRNGEGTSLDDRVDEGLQLVESLDHKDDVEARYGFHRIVALVSDEDGPDVDALLLDLGARGIRHVLRDNPNAPAESPFATRVLAEAQRIIRSRAVKKTALCLSGGGITGIHFELGVLKCLSDSLSNAALNRFDMLFGISAGGVVSSALAVGYSVDEFMASVAGHDDTRMPRVDLRLVRLEHIDFKSAARRAIRSTWRWVSGLVRPENRGLDSLLLEYSDALGPLFRSDGFERILREVLEVEGATNDFRDLNTELYIGSSDQDTRQHVLFGDQGHQHVSISKAVQASLSFSPAFPSVEIEGRYYEDGAVTRTSNFVEAIRRDATLVLVVDPFLPFVSKSPGATRNRGLFYQMDQSVRTISYTRFENARDWVLRRHPEVSVYTFLPSNRQRRLLSINPMDHRPYREIWRSAYMSTLARLERINHRLGGDLKAHGLSFDLTRPRYVMDQLNGKRRPDFEDFYPDRRVATPKPDLVRHARTATKLLGLTA